MQYWQRKVEEDGVANTLGNVHELLLPSAGLLGSLLIKIGVTDATGLGQSGGAWRAIDFLSKVEVMLNGSTVCKSFDGYTAMVLGAMDQKVIPPGAWRNYATNIQYQYVLLNFGRRMFDPTYQLDLGKYDNVYLKITNSGAVASISDFTTSVIGFYLKEKNGGQMSPGYMRTEEWRTWTTVQDETKYLKFPNEYKIRRILLRATPGLDGSNVENTNMANLMDNVLFTLKTGDIRLHDAGIADLMRDNYLSKGANWTTQGVQYMSADKGVRVDLGYVDGGAWGAGSLDGSGAGTIATMEASRTSFTQKPETYEADNPIEFIFHGIAPFQTAWFEFDQDDEPSTWLDPEAYKDVEMNIHTRNASSAASGVNKVVLDRFVSY